VPSPPIKKEGRDSYWRVIVTVWVPIASALILSVSFPVWGGVLWFIIAVFMVGMLNVLWEFIFDWRDLYRETMGVADQSIRHMIPNARGFVVLSHPRDLPPRLIWAVIVHDHSSRVYMGFHWWSKKEPDFRKAVSRGIRRRQVA
jgi:hypothetical protein